MTHLLPETCLAALGQYQHQSFRLYEYEINGYPVALVLEHTPCGFKDKLPITGVSIEIIRKGCKDHLAQCPAQWFSGGIELEIADEAIKIIGT